MENVFNNEKRLMNLNFLVDSDNYNIKKEKRYFIPFRETKPNFENPCWGIINRKGDVIINTWYDFIIGDYYDKNTLFKYVERNYNNDYQPKWGLFDSTGKSILKPVYDKIILSEDKTLVVTCKDDVWQLRNRKGLLIVREVFEEISFLNTQLMSVTKEVVLG